ncbi:MAG TPA: LysR family transcriptional regulator [Candidatus Avacidaminococcus intestinavium]|uniref:LysR family transcriptional regulator n=1 Tax=Candidatus Avacidaminococcus intestinavium TaxID=2840684 RepID=A0A9D1MNM2_9FIRM|nr:LysR family transcriptional regulator [Candidatus Avacidaminococcus intestinavium]
MNYSNIETFLAIAESKSLSKAAEKLFLSQSTISYRLNALEQDLNMKLVERDKGKSVITLTVKGNEFVSIAQMWKSLYKNTNEWKMQRSIQKLRIASVDSLNSCIFCELYKKLLNKDSPLLLNIGTHWTISIHEFIESQEADIGFVLWEVPSKNIVSKPLFIERMVLISSIAVNYPDKIHPSDLDLENEIYFYCGPNFRIWHDYWWDSNDKERSSVDTIALLKLFMRVAEHWSIVPISVARTLKKHLPIRISEIIDPPPGRVCYQITNKYQLPRSKKSLEIFEGYLNDFIHDDQFISLIK